MSARRRLAAVAEPERRDLPPALVEELGRIFGQALAEQFRADAEAIGAVGSGTPDAPFGATDHLVTRDTPGEP